MRMVIQSPSGIDNEVSGVDSLRVVLINGQPISILNNHAPLLAQVSAGKLEYKQSNTTHSISISEAIMVVNNNIIKIFALNHALLEN